MPACPQSGRGVGGADAFCAHGGNQITQPSQKQVSCARSVVEGIACVVVPPAIAD
jgi:hypothetical protein